MPGGDTYTIIYQKLLLLSLPESGILYFEGIENTLEEELALTISEEADNVKVALAFMFANKLIEKISDMEYYLSEAKYLTDSNTASSIRSQRCREKQRMLQCNITATKCNGDIEIDIEKERKVTYGNPKKEKTEGSVSPFSPSISEEKGKEINPVYISTAKEFRELKMETHANLKCISKADINKWADEVRKLVETDKKPIETVERVLWFAINDKFWRGNLISLQGLRNKNKSGISKFEQIECQLLSRGQK